MIEAGLYQRLVQDATVTGLAATRVYPLLLPDGATYPAITYQRISTVTSPSLSSTSDLVQSRFQFDCYALSYGLVKQMADALVRSLENFSGTLPSGDRVADVWLDSQYDMYEDEARLFRVSTDLMVLFYQD